MPMAKILLAVLGFALALSAIHVPAALAEAGELDHGFGEGGKTTTPVNLHAPWSQARVRLAETPDGRIMVAGAGKLVRYLADGELDRSFGDGGMVSIVLPGKLRFALGDVAIDREGRAVLIGTAHNGATPGRRSARAIRGARQSFATVIRYGADGELDPTFGNGGIVMTDFDLPPAQGHFAPAVVAGLGAVDAQDRIVLIAGTIERVSGCSGRSRIGRHDRLVARLTQAGALDTTFGHGGIERIRSLKSVASMAFDREGGAVLAGAAPEDCGRGPTLGLIRLRENGRQNRRFGKYGSRTLTGSAAAIAVDERDRIVVLCRSKQLSGPRRDENATKVVRLLPGGRLDPSFWGGWVTYFLQGPLTRWSALTTDSQDRPLLVGTLIRPLPQKNQKNGPRFHRWLMVERLRESGKLESEFGWQGWISITRFDRNSDAAASDALIDGEGRLLVAGTALRRRPAPEPGFALARFELKPFELSPSSDSPG